jgi:hypothetical protein
VPEPSARHPQGHANLYIMIVAPRRESISIDDGSPSREWSKEDVVRTLVIVPLACHESGSVSRPLRRLEPLAFASRGGMRRRARF